LETLAGCPGVDDRLHFFPGQRSVIDADFINQTIEGRYVSAQDRLPAQVADADSILVDAGVTGWLRRPQDAVVRSNVCTVQNAVDVDFDFTIHGVSSDSDMGEPIIGDRRE